MLWQEQRSSRNYCFRYKKNPAKPDSFYIENRAGTAFVQQADVRVDPVESPVCCKEKVSKAKQQKQQQDAAICQSKFSGGFCFFRFLPERVNQFRDGNQGKYKGIDGKPFQNKMLCDKQCNQKLVQGAVLKDSALGGILQPVSEQINQQAVNSGGDNVVKSIGIPEVAALVSSIFYRENGSQELKQRIKEQI